MVEEDGLVWLEWVLVVLLGVVAGLVQRYQSSVVHLLDRRLLELVSL